MDLQQQCIRDVCAQLKLNAMAEAYPQMAARAASNELIFADSFVGLLKTEVTTRYARSRNVPAKMAGFPVIKTLEEFDFIGVSKKLMPELSGLAFIEHRERRVAWAFRGGQPIWRSAWTICPPRPASKPVSSAPPIWWSPSWLPSDKSVCRSSSVAT
jgi:hypothetical protein